MASPSPPSPPNDAVLLRQAIAPHQGGRFDVAKQLYRSLLQLHPDHLDANYNLGLLEFQSGRTATALVHLKTALDGEPSEVQYWQSYANALLKTGNPGEALAVLRLALQQGLDTTELQAVRHAAEAELERNLDPPQGTLEPLFDLFQAGHYAEMENQAAAQSAQHPQCGQFWKILGVSRQMQGKSALDAFQRAARFLSDDAEAHSNLGNVLKDLRQTDAALASYRRALALAPDFAEAHFNLGNALSELGQFDAAAASYRRALEIKPHYLDALFNLGNTLDELGQRAAAMQFYRRALEIDPAYPAVQINLAVTLWHQNCYVEAEQSLKQALQLQPGNAEARHNHALILAMLSDYRQVLAESDAALALKPDSAALWEQRLYVLSYHPELAAQEIYNEFKRWGARFPEPRVDFSRHDRSPRRRLRVGYVSPDFRRHTSRFFFGPLFANHDHQQIELYAYANVKQEDEFTAKFKTQFDHWRDIRRLNDRDAAALVREDGIDILVDCCNHMNDDRLGVFTLKPAPIQVTWLGAAWTTGLPMVDYVLLDPFIAPEGTLTREKIVRLPHFFVAYQPPEETAEIAAPPCVRKAYVTYGYSGRTERLNHRTFRVWGEILRAQPEARLILDFAPFADPPTQAYYRGVLCEHGIDPERVTLRKSDNIFAGLNDVDILLDCFPHSGGTMLFDALWMGVPVLTLAGRPPVGRIGASLMTNLGLSDWVADSEDEYIAKAAIFAADMAGLVELRAGMRQRMVSSPVMDGAGFARGVESAYREMFNNWARQ